MSKRVDETKIERIREVAVELIGQQGLLNCSVAAIAKGAGVSVGYLYMHYASKDELINDLLEIHFNVINEKISLLLADDKSIEYVVGGVVWHILKMGEQCESNVKFLIMLLNDFSVSINPTLRQRFGDLAKELMDMVGRSQNLRDNLMAEDLYISMIALPLQYLSLRYRGILGGYISEKCECEKIVELSLNMIINR